MKRLIVLGLLVLLAIVTFASDYASLDLLNKTNLASYFNDYLGFVYDSHGCLHFTPADIYLLSKTIPPGTQLNIKRYQLKRDELSFSPNNIPDLTDLTKNEEDLKRHQEILQKGPTQLTTYPSLGLLVVMVGGRPYAKVEALAGPSEPYLMAQVVEQGKPIQWDFMLTTPTDPGQYKILRFTDHYISNAYYQNTIVPFGAWMAKRPTGWSFQKNNKWYNLPKHLITDLEKPFGQQVYDYYDLNLEKENKIKAARWASHDFGREVMLWTVDGKNHYAEMGYASGVLLYEQIMLVKDLVHILTLPGDDDFDRLISQNRNFSAYKELAENKDKRKKELLDKADPRVKKAYYEVVENRLPRDKKARYQSLGLYQNLRFNQLVIDKEAYWYERLKADWQLWQELRVKLRSDFDQMRIFSQANRQNILENWLSDRLLFKTAQPPGYVKIFQSGSIEEFFKPDEQMALFSEREKQEMLKVLQNTSDLKLASVNALNQYNFGLLLNEILGDLYKSHGCLHVSPRNSYFLYSLLPVGSQVTLYDYSKELTAEQLKDIQPIADLVDFEGELAGLKEKFTVTSEVKVAVYPASGYWVIYLQDKPFAKLSVRGGPKEPIYLVQGRDKEGRPIFEDHLAYPSTPGNYVVLRKEKNYLSNIYYDTTIIPMGGRIYWRNGKWVFQAKKGDWKELPKSVAADLNSKSEEQKYTYYDPIMTASGEVDSVKWGSQPFGLYTVQTSKDGRTLHPELIHSSGDLIMEERQLINDLIKVLAAPQDKLEDCVKYSETFDLYKNCYDFVADPTQDLIQTRERAAYKLYFSLPMSTAEVQVLP
ncbi:MAG: hypothetical protein KJ811_03755, partial [Candidatus Margulisbacteria bacterium]|nr:hypothetical protein [Candidatus Margulisiibacteriota bacterium]